MAPPPLVAIVGQTASGKSSLALALTEHIRAEIVCADSRTLYRDLSIASAKPSPAERAAVPHHLLDLLDLDELLTVPGFVTAAEQAIAEISGRGALPLLVGGTRAFVDAMLFQQERWPVGPHERAALADPAFTDDAIHALYRRTGTALPLSHHHRPTLIAALDGNRVLHRFGPRRQALILAVGPFEEDELACRIGERVAQMLQAGAAAEVQAICATHDRSPGTLNSIGYEEREPRQAGKASAEQVVDDIIRNTLAYAAGQREWLDWLPGLHWVRTVGQALALIDAWRR